MRATTLVLLTLGVGGLNAAQAATAGATPTSSPDLERALSALAAAAEQEDNLSPRFKDALSGVIEALRAQGESAGATDSGAAPPAVSASGDSKTFWDRLHPSGDIRVRYEHETNRPTSGDRDRARLRFRIGAEYDLTEDLALGFRVRTGNPDDPNSPYQTLGGMFDSFPFNLDRLYVRYRPQQVDDATGIATTAYAGKFANPFVTNPVYGELVWDADVNPEGLAGVFGYDLGEAVSVRFTPSIYVLQERDSASDPNLVTLQGSGQARWKDFTGRLASGWYRYFDVNTDFTVAQDRGNLECPDADMNGFPDCYLSKFSIVDTVASITWEGWAHPVTFAGEVWVNTEAANSDDTGYALGLRVGGSVRERHDWRAFYQWQRVEQESLFSAFAQDDFSLATNFQGHAFGLSYGLAPGVSLRPWVLMAEAIRTGGTGSFANDDLQTRLRVDLTASF